MPALSLHCPGNEDHNYQMKNYYEVQNEDKNKLTNDKLNGKSIARSFNRNESKFSKILTKFELKYNGRLDHFN